MGKILMHWEREWQGLGLLDQFLGHFYLDGGHIARGIGTDISRI